MTRSKNVKCRNVTLDEFFLFFLPFNGDEEGGVFGFRFIQALLRAAVLESTSLHVIMGKVVTTTSYLLK